MSGATSGGSALPLHGSPCSLVVRVFAAGMLVYDNKKIARAYFRSWFFLDVFTCIPLDSIFMVVAKLRNWETSGAYFSSEPPQYPGRCHVLRRDVDSAFTLVFGSRLPMRAVTGKVFRLLRMLRILKLIRLIRASRIVKRWCASI